MHTPSLRVGSLLLVATLTLGLAACSPAAEPDPVELTFASWVFISSEQQAFMDEVEAESGGSISFSPIENWTEPDGVEKLTDEFAMAEALATGDIDVGWTTARAFPALGIDGFRAVEAPFLIRSQDAANELVDGQTGEDAMAAFEGSGLTALSRSSGTLRYPLTASRPLLDPADWAGKRIQYYAPEEDSVQARTITALGGEPVAEGLHIVDDLNAGLYDGGLDSLYDVAAGGASPKGPFLTSNVVFWTTIVFYVINTERWESLSEEQRAIITTAAQNAADAEASTGPDTTVGKAVCAAFGRFGTSTPGQLAELKTAVQPVYDWLASDPVEAPTLAAIQEIASRHPDADVVDVPENCAWDAG